MKSAGILIVDDSPTNLALESEIVKQAGWSPRPVISGRLALAAAAVQVPDLVLLDVNMPDMDGFTVCRRFRETPSLADVPIIFVSGLSEPFDIIQAFRCGAVDYITKPFHAEEVQARIRTHLALRQARLLLEQRNRQLAETVDRLHAMEEVRDSLTHMIVHDMRSPLMALLNSLELCTVEPENTVRNTPRIELALKGAERLVDMVSSLLEVSRLENGQMPINRSPVDLAGLISTVMHSLTAGDIDPRIRRQDAEKNVVVPCDIDLIRRVIQNLVGNAMKFTPEDGTITIRSGCDNLNAYVAVSDTGPGISPELHDQVFLKFTPLAKGDRKISTGLGLAFCKLAVEAHGGHIKLESVVGSGSTFTVVLPTA